MKKMLFFPLIWCFGLTLFAETATDENGITWSYVRDPSVYTTINNGVQITGCESELSGDITIPVTLNGSPVSSIGAEALAGKSGVTSITIAGPVALIDTAAFAGCQNLKSITLPSNLEVIGSSAFVECQKLEIIKLPKSLRSIGESAFYYCSALKTLTIPEGVIEINAQAFGYCKTLTSVTIPSTVTLLGDTIFVGCDLLERIMFNGGPIMISPYVFESGIYEKSFKGYYLPTYASAWEEVIFDGKWNKLVMNVITGDVDNEETDNEDVDNEDVEVSVSNVTFQQRYPWNGLVDIYCAVQCSNPEEEIMLFVTATDMETQQQLSVKSIWLAEDSTQSQALMVTSGKHRLVWDAGKDNPNRVSSRVKINVQALVGTGLYLVIDLSEGASATSYPISYLGAEPIGGWTDEYKTTKLVLRLIQPGTFTMGSPSDELGRNSNEMQHQVTLIEPFYLGVFEVTQRQWQLVMGANPSSYAGDARPVECISWNMIRGHSSTYNWPSSAAVDETTFIGKLRAKTGLLRFDLPTEAQWEYACRAGSTTALNSGENLTETSSCTNLGEVGRYYYNKFDGKGGYSQHTKVGTYLPNAWGLYDMHGNVLEWCLDWYQLNLGQWAVTDPRGPLSGSYRIFRGGSWDNDARRCRSADRDGNDIPSSQFNYGGFRLACPAGQQLSNPHSRKSNGNH